MRSHAGTGAASAAPPRPRGCGAGCGRHTGDRTGPRTRPFSSGGSLTDDLPDATAQPPGRDDYLADFVVRKAPPKAFLHGRDAPVLTRGEGDPRARNPLLVEAGVEYDRVPQLGGGHGDRPVGDGERPGLGARLAPGPVPG